MKKFTFILLSCFALFSCKKENLLDGEELGINPFENPQAPFVEIINVREYVDCSFISFDLRVHHDRIPDTVVYTHFRITRSTDDPFITQKTSNIFTSANCSGTTTFSASLYHEEKRLNSIADTLILQR